jgi:hypothetical protein
MFPGFERIIEERIREAQKTGKFDNLPGKGKPFDFSNEPDLPAELRLAYKILKNADCLPPEIELKKEIQSMKELLAGETDLSRKYKLLKKINFMTLKLNAMRNTAVGFEMPQYYLDKLAEKLDPETF